MGEGSTGTRWKEGGSPKFAVAPIKLTVNALQDIFASNWFPWDAPSRTPCARGGTSPSSHRSAAASQVPCILRPSSFGDALVSSQHTAVPAASSWHFRVPCGRSPSREGGGQEGLSCLCPGRKRWLRHTSRWCSSETASCGRNGVGGEPPALRVGFGVGAPKLVVFFLNRPLGATKGFSCSAWGRFHATDAPLLLSSPTHKIFFFLSLFSFYPLPQRPGVTSLLFPLGTAFPAAAAVTQARRPLPSPTAGRVAHQLGESGMGKPPSATSADPAPFS